MANSKAINCCPIDGVDDEKLSCLNSFPKYAIEHKEDEYLIKKLNALCKKHGYGRVAQLCHQIREIWYDESEVETYKKQMEERLAYLEGARKWLESNHENS